MSENESGAVSVTIDEGVAVVRIDDGKANALSHALIEALHVALDRATAAGVATTVRLINAKPADALVQVGDELDATVIVVGTAGDSPFRGALLGSTPHKLLHLANRPVLCVPVAR